MAENSGFFASVDGDRDYTTDFLAAYIAAIIGNGVYNGDLAVTPGDGMQVVVPAGRAWINGYYYRNDAALPLTAATASGTLTRKDAVVLRWDINTRSITAQILTGTASANPTVPALVRDAETYDLRIAELTIPAGATSVTPGMIRDMRLDKTVCGIVTGVVDQLDTSAIAAQLDNFFTLYKQQAAGLYAQYQTALAGDQSSAAQTYTDFTAQLDAYKAQAQNDFESWFDGIKGQLGDDPATQLAANVTDLQTRVTALEAKITDPFTAAAKLAGSYLGAAYLAADY